MDNTLNFQVVERILDYIRENKMGPGDRLPAETLLVNEFQVSRVILREALSFLKALGLITSRRGSSYRVSSASISGTLSAVLSALARGGITPLEEVYELRRIMEIGMIADAVERADDDDRREVKEALAKLESFTEITDSNVALQYCLAELNFHRTLLKPSGCQMLEIIDKAMEHFFRYQFKRNEQKGQLTIDELRRTNLAHSALAEAFELGNPLATLILLREHLHKKLRRFSF